jgi:hypothetical protein
MAILGRKAPPIQVGDRFIKAGNQLAKVWEVSRLWTTVDEIPHARLVSRGDTLAVSLGTLNDPQFFTPAPVAVVME